jgi:hypothetical protein
LSELPMREDVSPATEDVARGYWAGAKDAGLRAQAGAYRFADDQPPTKTTNQYRQTER